MTPAPLPASIKALTRERPCFAPAPASPFPLRAADGCFWWQVKADREKAA
jgi:hypothetical protein